MQATEFEMNWDDVTREIVTFIKKTVADSNADGVVVGLSGGVDSSLVVKLSVMALGPTKVLGVLLPTEFTPKEDVEDAKELARLLGVRTETITIQSIVDSFKQSMGPHGNASRDKIPLANLRSRIRMVILFYFANLYNLLVAGTGDRSEDLIGYFTKYGDGGVDFLPISHLYKTQVRMLASNLDIPRKIAYKPSSPQLYPGHKATDEIPIDYDKMDRIQRLLFDEKLSPEETAHRSSIDVGIVEEILRRYHSSAHKRAFPPMTRSW